MPGSSQVDSTLLHPRAVSVGEIIRFVILCVVLSLPLLSFGFYSFHSRVLISTLIVCLVAVTIYDPLKGLSFLLVASIFFGNHPGGRYLEIFDYLLMIWVALSEFLTRKSKIYTYAKGYEWLFLFSCLLSLVASHFLLKDIFNHILHPYFIFTANETEPLYAVKMLIMTFTCICAGLVVYRSVLQQGQAVTDVLARTILFAVAIAIGAAILETHNSNVAHWLADMRFSIDHDFDNSAPHTLIPFLSWLQGSIAAKGLFWNRGWFAVYLIASFPFMLYFLHKDLIGKPGPWKISLAIGILTIFFYTLLLIGARGAFLAFIFSCLFYFVSRGTVSYRPVLRVIPYLILTFVVLFPWTAFIDSMQPLLDPRVGFFKAGFEIGRSNLVFGGGAESFGWNNIIYLGNTPLFSLLFSTHNQMLQVFSGQGLVGVICYVALILFVIRCLNKPYGADSNSLPLLSGFLGILIYSSFQEWFYLRCVQLMWWLLIAVCVLPFDEKESKKDEPPRRQWRWTVVVLLVCAAVATAASQHPPKSFGFSPPLTSTPQKWQWVIAKEAWGEIPTGTNQIKIQLRNIRPDTIPYFVTVEVPYVYKTTVRFDRTLKSKLLTITLPQNSESHDLKVSCDRIWSSIDFNEPDSRKLCIVAHVEFRPAVVSF